jgi:hypothetical protein
VLTVAEWSARRAAHELRVDGWTSGHRERAARQVPHPVEDFLFTYYSHRPSRLRRWSPGAFVACEAYDADQPWLDVPDKARRTAAWVVDLLERTASRPSQFGCFGLHEWAMAYRAAPRHRDWPLRLGEEGTAAVVEAQPLRCSHHDAFRFFTEPARPLNVLQPRREDQADLEQGGCLHANMDLYKWSYKLSPWIASELVADCFALARRVRVLDMRASPYDLSALGHSAVPIETEVGRADYVRQQRAFAEEAATLRSRLVEVARPLARTA